MNDAHASLKRETAADGMSGGREQKLPLRDWILLPVLGLLTICVVAFSAEAIAWRTFPESASSVRDCYRSGGVGAIPNSVCWEKVPEGELTEFKFNSCGDRAGMECGPKPPETLRIVMVGSSFAMGLYTARERTFAALLPTELSRQTRHKIELYNEGILGGAPPLISQNFNRALAAKPDLILWILTPWDMGNTAFELNGNAPLRSPEPAGKKGSMAWTLHRLKFAVTTNSIYNTALDRWHQDKLNLLLRHFLYESQTLYLQSYMKGSMRTLAGFLYTEPDAEWRDHLRGTDIYASDIEERSRVAGVPVVVAVLIPNRAQADALHGRVASGLRSLQAGRRGTRHRHEPWRNLYRHFAGLPQYTQL
jgi:hypothetical protein